MTAEQSPAARVVYMVSRFPKTSETFIVRELDGLARLGTLEVHLHSLFVSRDATVHEVARPWVGRVVRPGLSAAAAGLVWALGRHFTVTCAIIATVLREHLHKPAIAVRALCTVTLAFAHARALARDRAALERTHIHAHYATYPALAAWTCKQLLGIPYSFTAHAHDLYVDRSMLATKLADAEFIVSVSEFNRVMLLDSVTTARDVPIYVIHCGIDLNKYRFRRREPAADGPVRALCVASLQEYKGHRFLLEAVAGPGPVSRIELDLIGAGPLLDSLRRQAEELGIAARVRFLGARSEAEVRDALDHADLFVLPSIVSDNGQMEGLPVALMEALAAGVPTVSTALSGIPEIIIHRVTGLLAQPGDSQNLRATVEETISDGGAAMVRASAGRALVEREFALDKTIAELAEVLHRSMRRCSLTG